MNNAHISIFYTFKVGYWKNQFFLIDVNKGKQIVVFSSMAVIEVRLCKLFGQFLDLKQWNVGH